MSKSIEIQCTCTMLDCAMRITDWDDSTYSVEIIMPRVGFWFRIKRAFRYVFGTETLGVCDVLVSRDDLRRIIQ